MAETALEIGADTFQFFARNPRGGGCRPFDPKDVDCLENLRRQHAFASLVAHAPYTLNPCAANPAVRQFAHTVFLEDMEKLDQLSSVLYTFHPGCHVGQGAEKGISLIADTLNHVLKPEQKVVVLLETMSGKGSEIGSTFEELARILDRVERREKMGVCLDTCHVFAAGYDIVHDLEGVLEEFDRTIGLSALMAVHLNDSQTPLGSRKDRHASIGAGHIGHDAFGRIVTHPLLSGLPFILETPNDFAGYAAEIEVLKKFFG